MEKECKKLKKRVGETLEKVEKEQRVERKGWWDGECKEMKAKERKELKRWKKEKGEGGRYKATRKEYREMCEEKKRRERER